MDQIPPQPLRPRAEAAVVVAAVLGFAVVAAFKAAHHPYPFFDDVDFLDLGNRVRLAGGPLRLLEQLFSGQFREANRHPLYLALLSLFARPELGYHRDAQVLAVVLGVTALLSCWWAARRHVGARAAAVLIALLSASGALVWTASLECSDALLVAFWAQAVGKILDGGREGNDARRAWLWAGVWSGLCYLTKGPGLFLPICLALTLLLRKRLSALRDVRAWLFAAAFALTSLPLWWRNLRVFGSPVYNINGRYLWIDRLPDFAEVFAPYADARLPNGLGQYLAQATPGSIAWRAGMGVAETLFHLGDSLSLVAPTPGGVLHIIWVVLGVAAAAFAARLLWRGPPGFARTFHLVHLGWWTLFLAFFNASGGAARYFLPLTATSLAPALALALSHRRRLPVVMGLGAFAVLSTLAGDRSPTRPPPGFLEVQDWMLRNVKPGEVYAVDARTHLQPRWLLPAAQQLIVSASWKVRPVPVEEMLRYLCEERVRYLVLDGGSHTDGVERGASPSRYLFYDRLPLGPDGALPLSGFPGAMRPVYVGAESPRRWIVLATACSQENDDPRDRL